MTFSDKIRQEARLVILRALASEPDRRLNSSLIVIALDQFGINRSRDWVHEELRWLADIDAVRIEDVGSVRIAALSQKGLDHVERRIVLEGIKRPSAEG
jgi:hypothetical protein